MLTNELYENLRQKFLGSQRNFSLSLYTGKHNQYEIKLGWINKSGYDYDWFNLMVNQQSTQTSFRWHIDSRRVDFDYLVKEIIGSIDQHLLSKSERECLSNLVPYLNYTVGDKLKALKDKEI